MKKAVLLLVAIFATTLSFAQAQVEIPKEIKDLSWVLGTWEGTTTWDMDGQTSDTKDVMVFTMLGSFIHYSNKVEMAGFAMEEHGFISWDADKKKYKMVSYTSFGPKPRVEYGTYSNGVLQMVSEPFEVSGVGEFVGRGTMTKKSDSELTFTLEMKQGDAWVPSSKGNFKKKK